MMLKSNLYFVPVIFFCNFWQWALILIEVILDDYLLVYMCVFYIPCGQEIKIAVGCYSR